MQKLQYVIGQALCFLGWHSFEVLEVRFGFGPGGDVEKVRCRRCGLALSRQARRRS